VAALPLVGAAVIMSSTRSAWLGTYLATLLMAGLDRRRKILLPAIAAATVAGIVGAIFVLPSTSSLEERASSLEPIRARLVMWELGLRIAVKQPVTGYGRGAPSRIAARKELMAIGSPDAEFAAGQFHNTFLMALVELGIVGLAADIAILVLIVRAAMQLRRRLDRDRHLAFHFAGLVLGTFVVFATQMMFIDTPPMLYLNGLCFLFAGLMFAQLDAAAPDRALETESSYGRDAARSESLALGATATTGGLKWRVTN
jgi:O-antigen ligase